MATWILPVLAGRTHQGGAITKALGTFSSMDEALQTGVRMVKAGTILDFQQPVEQMTLVQYSSWRAAMAAANSGSSLQPGNPA